MLHILGSIIIGLSNGFAHTYIFFKLINKKIDFKEKYFLLKLVVFSFFLLINYFLVNGFIRIITIIIILCSYFYFLKKQNIKEAIIAGFMSELIIMASEILYIFLMSTITTNNINSFVQNYFGTVMTNVLISVMAILMSNIKILRKIYNSLCKIIRNIDIKLIVLIIGILFISLNIIFNCFYANIDLSSMIFLNTIISTIYLIITYYILLTKDKFLTINKKYNTTLNSLKEYEEILDVYRISNHENKNELLTIRSMIMKKEKDVSKYIDKIINNKIKDDEKLMFDVNIIPSGGLRATIYSKMLYMKEKKINFYLNVDRKVRTVELIQLGEDLTLNVCKIIGVFLDNAIEASENVNEKKVGIYLFLEENYLCIEISNNFIYNFEPSKLDRKGYTTKKSGHGYGLALVKEIIDNSNQTLVNVRKINKNNFVQILKIKIK